MRKLSVMALGAIAAFSMSTLASAASGANGDGRPPLPPGAVQVSENVYYLGKKQVAGAELEGYAFVLRAKAHPSQSRANEAGRKPSKACYSVIGFPAWASAEPWKVNTDGARVSSSTMVSGMEAGVGAWESASGADIFGSGSIDNSAHANASADGQNVVEFGDAGGAGTVAVTYVWGSRRVAIYEWDMIFGADWDWSDGGSSTAFDFLDVATHEIGHAAGLDHPANTCTQETMYAYVDFGETHKRTLNDGDIAGINALY